MLRVYSVSDQIAFIAKVNMHLVQVTSRVLELLYIVADIASVIAFRLRAPVPTYGNGALSAKQ